MIKKILAAYDGSAEANAAFDFGLDLAKTYQAELQVLSVVQLPEPPMEVEIDEVMENGNAHYKHLFGELRKRAKAVEIDIKTMTVTGHPAEQIVHYAVKDKVDVIVIGHQTKSKLGKWLAGAVTDKVVDHAQCDVIVVKRKKV